MNGCLLNINICISVYYFWTDRHSKRFTHKSKVGYTKVKIFVLDAISTTRRETTAKHITFASISNKKMLLFFMLASLHKLSSLNHWNLTFFQS